MKGVKQIRNVLYNAGYKSRYIFCFKVYAKQVNLNKRHNFSGEFFTFDKFTFLESFKKGVGLFLHKKS